MILICKGTCAPVASPFKGQGGSAPVIHPRSGVRGCSFCQILLALKFSRDGL